MKRRAYHAEKYDNPEQNHETDDQRYVTFCILQISLFYYESLRLSQHGWPCGPPHGRLSMM